MSTDAPKRGYHHGNLRAALVDAALELIEERGSTAFTFAELARKADVSPAAPYRHFKDREALIQEIARIGFLALAELLEDAWARHQPSAIRAFDAVTAGYLDFARRERAHFTVMFQTDLAERAPKLEEAGERAFAVLHRACGALVDERGGSTPPPVSMMSQHIWALSHGIAQLFGTPGRTRPSQIQASEMLEAATGIYLRGLGLIDPD
ncbi:MAG: TetR/AcrR family transcriptional regulator [Pseudomonadota bacterium]